VKQLKQMPVVISSIFSCADDKIIIFTHAGSSQCVAMVISGRWLYVCECPCSKRKMTNY